MRGHTAFLIAPAAPFYFAEGAAGCWMMIVCGGCVISGSQISRSVLSSNVKVSSFCNINEAVLLPQVTVGASCRLQKVVVDRGCAIPDGTVIGEDPVSDAERFYRTDSARTSRGTGLGLAIVKHIVGAAGGEVEADGGPGRGLRIRATFPP